MSIKPIIVYEGEIFTVECAIGANGVSECKVFLESLDKKLNAKIFSIIKRFANHGRISNREQFKKVEGNLWEFKHYQTRVIMYYCAKGRIALINGFIKKQKKIPKSEIDRANRIKNEYEIIRKGVKNEQ